MSESGSSEDVTPSDADESSSPTELVPESEPEIGIDGEDETPAATTPIPAEIEALQTQLSNDGFKTRIRSSSIGFEEGEIERQVHTLVLDLPSDAEASRTVYVSTERAAALLNVDLKGWKSLIRYEGLVSREAGTIEVLVRPAPFAGSLQRLLARFSDSEIRDTSKASTLKPGTQALVASNPQGLELSIGPASELGGAILGRRMGPGRVWTLILRNITIEDDDDADELLEHITDAFFFDLDVSFGVSIFLSRLEPRHGRPYRSLRPYPAKPPSFPTNSYAHEPVMLYRTARERQLSPVVRYWAFYQVLEYFFPKYVLAEARTRLAQLVRDPRFDPHSDYDITKAVQVLLERQGGSNLREVEQLELTLKAVVSSTELEELIGDASLWTHLGDRKSEISTHWLTERSTDDLRQSIARRIYQIRCRIVHAKELSEDGKTGGLIPGSHHDDLIRAELPLMEFLAQRAIIASAERLSIN